jgi:hypothetical protein
MRNAQQPENGDRATDRWALATIRILDAIRAGDVEAARRHLAVREEILFQLESVPSLTSETRAKLEAAITEEEAVQASLRSQLDIAAGELRTTGQTHRTLRSYTSPTSTGHQVHEVI